MFMQRPDAELHVMSFGHLPHGRCVAMLHDWPGLGHVPIVSAPGDRASRIDSFSQRLALAGAAAHRLP